MKSTAELLDELSFLSRETSGASFVIQHCKDSGKWKVVFSNVMMTTKEKLKETDFDQTLTEAIDFIKMYRKPITVPEEKYTMFNR